MNKKKNIKNNKFIKNIYNLLSKKKKKMGQNETKDSDDVIRIVICEPGHSYYLPEERLRCLNKVANDFSPHPLFKQKVPNAQNLWA